MTWCDNGRQVTLLSSTTTCLNMSATLRALVIIFTLCSSYAAVVSQCPCSNEKFCERITASSSPEKEVLVWSTSPLAWRHYDWSIVTTIAVFRDWDNDLMCFAHSKGVKVVMMAFYNIAELANETMKHEWVANLTRDAARNHADGVNIDLEGPVAKDSTDVALLTNLTKQLSQSFKKNFPGSQISFDVAWSPDCIDGRCYDVTAISKVVDFLAIMAYDEMSQIFDAQCTARANSPFNKTKSGIAKYLQLGIKASQLVLGLPWYGYDYMCEFVTGVDTCHIKKVPFRGANCSDAAGSQIAYSSVIDKLMTRSARGRHWDKASQTPFFDYYDQFGRTHQLWYDDAQSLGIKLNYAKQIGMRGAAVWNSDLLDYSPLERSVEATQEMWQTLGSIKNTIKRPKKS